LVLFCELLGPLLNWGVVEVWAGRDPEPNMEEGGPGGKGLTGGLTGLLVTGVIVLLAGVLGIDLFTGVVLRPLELTGVLPIILLVLTAVFDTSLFTGVFPRFLSAGVLGVFLVARVLAVFLLAGMFEAFLLPGMFPLAGPLL